MKKKRPYYCSNSLILLQYQEWKSKLKKDPHAEMPRKFAKNIKLIVDRIGTSHKFSSYTYLDDMKSLALYNITKYIYNFDPDQSPYIVTYISKIAYNSFLKIINDEKKKQNRKKKYLDYMFSLSGKNQSKKNASDIDRFNDFEPKDQSFGQMKLYKKGDKENSITFNTEEEFEDYCEKNYNKDY